MTKEACSRLVAERLLATSEEVAQAEIEAEDDYSDRIDNWTALMAFAENIGH